MIRYKTSHQGAAALLRYVLGDAAHLRTSRRADGRLSFVFADTEGNAAAIAETFFSPEGTAIANAREFLAVDRAVRATVGECIEHGEWRNEQ